ncbi:methylated-DNA--[protein]-cysteine S-methyltransferase [Pedobacter sp. L105]|uniref:methylated-DNA--[protein]-cysteine S-methyltransferase n=1 Tax=Pedobacter sp. L105 TaxID=1641871 RepID=UPI00131AB55B|nr:methylated-DNA--[protein]-cysteine S-methyltransferase [Pedobacter sp. L105]
MNNFVKEFRGTDNHINEITDVPVRNSKYKQAMKARIEHTKLSAMPDSIHIKSWEDEDLGQPVAYQFAISAFGEILIGSTAKGVCFVGFTNNNREETLKDLKRRFPASVMEEKETEWQREIIVQMNHPEEQLPVHLHLKGTGFQLDIWKKLLQVPYGGVITYAQLGGSSKIARAAGTAVGRNPVCYILPCHRVVHGDGSFNGYFWGNDLKKKLLTWEAAAEAFEVIRTLN